MEKRDGVTTQPNYELLNLMFSSLSLTTTSTTENELSCVGNRVEQINKFLFVQMGELLKKQAESNSEKNHLEIENSALKGRVEKLEKEVEHKKIKIKEIKSELSEIKSKQVEERLKVERELELSKQQMQERMHGKDKAVEEKKNDNEFKAQLGVAGIAAGGKVFEKAVEVGPTHAMTYWNSKKAG